MNKAFTLKNNLAILFLSACMALTTVSAFAKNQEQSVTFAKGSTQANLAGSFKGYDDVQYKIYAKKQQTLKFKLKSTADLAYINIYAPGDKPGQAEALLIGAAIGSVGELTLPSNGEYTIQVYQMRNTARQNKTVKFNLNIQILNPSHSMLKNFNAVGELPCSLSLGQPTTQCKYGVVRHGNGTADLSVFSKQNKEYLLKFKQGKLVSPAGKTQKRANLSLLELDSKQRFEVLDSILYAR